MIRRSPRRPLLRTAACAALGALLCAIQPSTAAAAPAAPADPASLVQLLTGTAGGGGTFPGAAVPFGMVQYSPDTPNAEGGGYEYNSPQTWGFSPVHLSGPGCHAMGDIASLPTTGQVTGVDLTKQATPFSHDTEHATPGTYSVTLASGVRTELTATTRTGLARYTFPGAGQANVIIEPGAGFMGSSASDIHIVDDHTVEGEVTSWGYFGVCTAKSANRYTLHFTMSFDHPFTAYGTGNGGTLNPGEHDASGTAAGAWVSFDPHRTPTVTSRVGISFTSLDGARANLAAESAGDFDTVRDTAHRAWNAWLGRVQVAGGTPQQQSVFYTALYHSLLHPNVFSDTDGRYMGFDGTVHRVPPGQVHYSDFSLWDTYRTTQELQDLVAPDLMPDMMSSLLDDYRQGGWLPRWPYANYYTNEMVGDPAANLLTDAYLKGLLRPADVATAYTAVLHNADDLPRQTPSSFKGRSGLDHYLNDGYVPYQGGDDQFAGSMQLEYGINDCAVSLFARGYGRRADAQRFLDRAQRYRNLIDPSTGFVRPRTPDGSWLSPFDPAGQTGFKEGTSWRYTWLAPQDVSGLATALGGRDAAITKLDQFFAYDRLPADPSGTAKKAWGAGDTYDPTNETDLQAPYLYDYLGQPWKTQDVVRAAETLFTTAPAGIPGNDDLGAMSSWYVLSALGLYPELAGSPAYALTSPLFPHAVVHVDQPGGRRHTIVVDAPVTSAAARYIDSVTLGGHPVTTSQIGHDALLRGGVLHFDLGTRPGQPWATGPGQVPASACSARPHTADLRIALAGAPGTIPAGGSGTVTVTLRNAGDLTAGHPAVTLDLPPGWTSRVTGTPPAGLPAGATATETFSVTAPAGTPSGAVPVRAYGSWRAADGPGEGLRTLALATLTTG